MMKWTICLVISMTGLYPCPALAHEFGVDSCSWLGDAGNNNAVRGLRITDDGSILLAANVGSTTPGGVTPLLLNNATNTTSGCVVRLSPDGKTVLAVTRLADELLDMDLDDNENIYLAAGNDGLIKLNPDADNLLWQRAAGGYVRRVDAGSDGTNAALDAISELEPGSIHVHQQDGSFIASFGGMHFTQDLAIHSSLQMIYTVGFRNSHSNCNPVQVAYIKAHDYNGNQIWRNYDWPGWMLDPCNEGIEINNMADTRGYRCDIGYDNLLYVGFESAGGNHIFRYAPTDLNTPVTVVGGDMWHNWYNTKSEHKTFFARYAPETGDYYLGQQFCTRNSSGGGNTVRVKDGDITSDSYGRVYVVGPSASGLPIPYVPQYSPDPDQIAFNPFPPTTYTGGAYILVMNQDMTTRLYCTRLCGGTTHAVDARVLTGQSEAHIAWGGSADDWLFELDPIQTGYGGGDHDGFYAVLGGTAGVGENTQYIINFNSDNYVTTSRLLRDSNEIITPVDLDGDGDDDSTCEYPYSDTSPLSPTIDYYGPDIYGGVRGRAINSTTMPFNDNHLTNGTPDRINIRYQPPTGVTADFHMVLYITKDDFENVADTQTVHFDESSIMNLNLPYAISPMRWLVRDGSTFYVSEETFSGSAVRYFLTDTDGNWAIYNPDIDIDFNSDTASFLTRDFSNITAVGFIIDLDTYTPDRLWIQMTKFTVKAAIQGDTAVTAPTNLSAMANTASQIELTWTDNSTGESGYVIQRSPYNRNTNWHNIADLPPNTTSYTDTDSLYGFTQYTYRVGAVE